MSNRIELRKYDDTSVREVETLIEIAKTYLPSSTMPFEVLFEHIGGGTFNNITNGAVYSFDRRAIIINIEWYTAADMQDIKYLVWHETRHAYQRTQVEYSKQGLPTSETKKRVKKWRREFENYISLSAENEEAHMTQDIETDAYAFALYLLFLKCPNADGSIDIGLPECIEDELMRRVSSQKGGMFRCY